MRTCWQKIVEWVTVQQPMLSILFAFIGAVATIAAAYQARRIFKDGLQVSRDKVLDELSLELVTEFIIPFSELRTIATIEITGNSLTLGTTP